MLTNWVAACVNEKESSKIAARLKRNNTNAVASLIILSPSRMVIMRLFAPNFFITATAEVASVGETIAPNKSPSFQVNPGISLLVIKDTEMAVNIVNPNANNPIGLKLNLKSN